MWSQDQTHHKTHHYNISYHCSIPNDTKIWTSEVTIRSCQTSPKIGSSTRLPNPAITSKDPHVNLSPKNIMVWLLKDWKSKLGERERFCFFVGHVHSIPMSSKFEPGYPCVVHHMKRTSVVLMMWNQSFSLEWQCFVKSHAIRHLLVWHMKYHLINDYH